jgi:hypothetical protein
MQPKEFINQAVKILTQVDSLNEELKYLKDDAKESGLDVASLVAVAKAVVANKVDDLFSKSEKTLEAIEIARS